MFLKAFGLRECELIDPEHNSMQATIDVEEKWRFDR